MELDQTKTSKHLPDLVNPIRVETALSRYPVHRLAKKGTTDIEIREESQDGGMLVKWEVSHNSKAGQPGPLAYKLDTLIINRRIEENARPISRIIRLGSLREITEELGLSTHNNKIKNALHQNASTYIQAKISYKLTDGTEKHLEAGFTRYSVVFTGERLPNGRKADAVYIVLNDVYMGVINGAMTRPLDYDYLKTLPPGPQRFYEILSFQMYAAIKNERPRAKLLYSEFCTYAPMTRHEDWTRVRSQMNKIHRPHFDSGYIAKVDYQNTTDSEGNPDWEMCYQPGPKAKAEFRAFTKRGGPVLLEVEPYTLEPLPLFNHTNAPQLEAELVKYGVTPAIAAGLVREHDEVTIQEQIEILEWQEEKKPGKIADRAAWLVSGIKTGHAVPKGFVSQSERQQRDETKQAKERLATADRRRKQEKDAHERRQRQRIEAFWNAMTPQEQAGFDVTAKAEAEPELLQLLQGPMKKFGVKTVRDTCIVKLLRAKGELPPFEQ